jgi:hypothetical protein
MGAKRSHAVPKPPESTPHSDISGVHQDEERNTRVASETGEGAGELQRAHEEKSGRPPYADETPAGGSGDEAEAHPS